MHKVFLSFSLLLLIPLYPLQGEESISKQVRLLGWPAAVEELYHEMDGEIRPTLIRQARASKYSTLEADEDLILYRQVETAEDGIFDYLPVVSLDYNELPASSLVLVLTTGDRYQLLPIDDRTQSSPSNSLTVFNLAPYRIATLINEKVQQIGPFERIVFKDLPGNAHSRLQVAGYRDDNETVRFNTSILLRAGFRYFMFIQDTSITKVPGRDEDVGLEFFYVSDYLK